MTSKEKKMVQALADASEKLVLAVIRDTLLRGTSAAMNFNTPVLHATEELIQGGYIKRPS